MAIFHFNAKVIKRSAGHSAIAAAAYCSADCIKDKRLRTVLDYRNKRGVVYSKILAPQNSPVWSCDREQLWNKVEDIEKRKDSQVAREITLALPKELTLEQQKYLLVEFIQECFVMQGMIADFSIHYDNPDNPHAHILLTLRKLESDSFGKKVREWNDSAMLIVWREKWAIIANQHLQNAGHSQQISHQSHAVRGLKQKPSIHLGRKNYYALKYRSVLLSRALINQSITHLVQEKNDKDKTKLLSQFGLFCQEMVAKHDDNLQHLEEVATVNHIRNTK